MQKEQGIPAQEQQIKVVANRALKPLEVTQYLTTIRTLYTKLYLIQQRRFADLAEYQEGVNRDFEEETGLRVEYGGPKQRGAFRKGTTINIIAPVRNDPVILESVDRILREIKDNASTK